MLTLHSFPKATGKRKLRYGRGNSKRGNYSGRGIKGQRARSGGKGGLKLRGLKQSFMGIPKSRGFRSPKSLAAIRQIVNLQTLEKNFNSGEVVNAAVLYKKGLILSARQPVKVLSGGRLTKKLSVRLAAASVKALAAIKAVGGDFLASSGSSGSAMANGSIKSHK